MTNTTYYNLKQPEDNDNVLISDLNDNADAIDQALHGLDESLKGLKYEPPLSQAGSKSAVADGDSVVITDSADSNKTKRVLWSAVKSALAALFAAKTHEHAATDITSGTLSIGHGGTGQTTSVDAAQALGRGYAVCNTPASTADKTVSQSNFPLNTGAVIGIRFTYENTAMNPTLNVNEKGAKPIYNCHTNTSIKPGDITKYMTAFFMYNGVQWVLLNPAGGGPAVSGTYVGTGTYGASNPNKISVNFSPRIALIRPLPSHVAPRHTTILFRGATYADSWTDASPRGGALKVTFGEYDVSWYAINGVWDSSSSGSGEADATKQLNEAERTYEYLIM